ncbi:MAG: putative 2OG-Fe(II) oxygenase, partial [Allosphingosinicella sp.]
ALLGRALAADPANPNLHLRLALLALDAFDFRAAAAGFEAVLRLDPGKPHVRGRLAGCYNVVQDFERALDVLSGETGAQHERGIALAGLGLEAEAEAEFRAVLSADPHNRQACRKLCHSLRRSARWPELLATCEALDERGAAHTQLFYDWGMALALNGQRAKAQSILFDRRRVAAARLPVPEGWGDIEGFNAALAEEILANPDRLSDFVAEEAANRGSSRVHSLLTGRRPDLVRQLLGMIETAASAYPAGRPGAFDPWAAARPDTARLNAWGLIQRGGDYEEWHMHRDGWLSGVYYVRIPSTVSAEGGGPGCIEFGPPSSLEAVMPGVVPYWRCAPEEGMLLLAPSHYAHRTIPTGSNEYRISFAFDVVPVKAC